MSQSIDFRINDFINEYLDYKGYTNTVDAFSKERQTRKEPITKINNNNLHEKEKYKKLKVLNNFLFVIIILFLFI